jgi:hypothetical protein
MKRSPLVVLAILALGCSSSSSSDQDGVNSEVAISAVSGSVNLPASTTLGLNGPMPAPRSRPLDRLWEAVAPVGKALAATWTCSGGSLSPAFAGPADNPYLDTPVSCSVTWLNGKTTSSDWSSTFILNYGQSCDSTHALLGNQAAGCSVTRTTAVGGNTRTLTGPDGNAYAVTHDTHGASTGWDTAVTPAPTNAGVALTCASAGCSSGESLVIGGSHLTGTLIPAGGSATTFWDHTVSTDATGLSITGGGITRTVSGAVTVQHNLLKTTSTTTFDAVIYGSLACCFPTSGSVTTEFTDGSLAGKSETVTFSELCGEATLTTASGKSEAITLLSCI